MDNINNFNNNEFGETTVLTPEMAETPVETVEPATEMPYTETPYVDAPVAPAPAKKETNIFAIISLIAGVLSIIFNCCCGWLSIPLGIIAIILGAICPKDANGKKSGLAIAGIICGVVAILFFVVSLIISLVFPAFSTMFMKATGQKIYY